MTESGAAQSEFNREAWLADLVRGMAARDQDALARLYDATSPLVNGLMLRMLRDKEDAEEALLDVYMKAWKYAGSYAPERSGVQAWLVMMARGIAIDRIRHRRAQSKTAGHEIEADSSFSLTASPEQQTLQSERRSEMQRMLEALSGEQREVLLMAFFAGYTHSELSGHLGQPLGTVKSRIRTALIKLRELMDGRA
jgi:RNA polymerase sigma-70 factor (ECF subfamily)